MTFEQRMNEFEGMSTDAAYTEHVKDDPRRELVIRAKAAFWELMEAKVPAEVYDELRRAWLVVDEAEGDYEALVQRVTYWQGFFDGTNVRTSDVQRLATSDGPLYSRSKATAKIEQLEQAAMNGAAEKVAT